MGMETELYQKFIKSISYILIGFSGLGVIFDAVSNSLSLLTHDISFMLIICGLSLWIFTEYYVRKRKPIWINSDHSKIRITKFKQKIRLSITGALVLLSLPIAKEYYSKSENIEITSFPIAASESLQLFDSEESFNILLLPFGTSQNCKNETIVCEREVYFRFKNRLLLSNSNDIDVALYNDSDSLRLYTHDEAWEIGKQANADLVVWGDYNSRCNSDSTKIRLNWLNIEWYVPFENQIYDNSYVSVSDISLIEKGKITGNVEEIIYWALAARAIEGRNEENALFYFEQINGKDHEDYSPLFYFLGRTRLRIAFECGLPVDEINKAKEEIETALKYNTEDEMLYNMLASANYLLGDFQEAILAAKEAVRLDPGYVTAIYNLATILSRIEKYDESLSYYSIVIDSLEINSNAFNPAHKVYRGRGGCYRELGRHSEALEDYNKVIAMGNGDFKSYIIRCELNYILGNYQNAINDCTIAQRLNPTFSGSSLYYYRGVSYHKLGEFQKSAEDRIMYDSLKNGYEN
jgi:tetratricopeptide (TPR) repeat protein